MTSEQVMLTTVVFWISGCALFAPHGAEPLASPYPTRRVWAVAPLRNQSGTLAADGVALADHLARQLEGAANIDVLPVNRTIQAMAAMELGEITSPAQALGLLGHLGADALVVGTISDYDPYDPPKLGLAIELYVNEKVEYLDAVDIRRLSREAIDDGQPLAVMGDRLRQPMSVVSAFFDAASPAVREQIKRYTVDRGQDRQAQAWHLYRINMDLYSEFVSYVMSWRLLVAEAQRLAPPITEPAR